MSTGRRTLLAFLASGAIWISGFALGMNVGIILILGAAAYVALGSLVLASGSAPTGPALLGLWMTAVLLLTMVGYLPEAGIWMGIYIGAVFGPLLFGLWCATGYLLLHVVTGGPGQDHRQHRARP